MFFFCDQEANETFDTYLKSLRRLASSREFAQLEEELIRHRIVLGTTDGRVRARMLKERTITDTRSSSNDASKQSDNTAVPVEVQEATQ